MSLYLAKLSHQLRFLIGLKQSFFAVALLIEEDADTGHFYPYKQIVQTVNRSCFRFVHTTLKTNKLDRSTRYDHH